MCERTNPRHKRGDFCVALQGINEEFVRTDLARRFDLKKWKIVDVVCLGPIVAA